MTTLFGQTLSEISNWANAKGLPVYRAKQIAQWLYQKNITSIDDMTNLPLSVRDMMNEEFEYGLYGPVRVSESTDGTKKYLFPAGEGKFIETAYIPEEKRATLCLSTQVGCKMRCQFCMTGKQGFSGNLDSSRILNQFKSLPEFDKLTNIVYMGMGEPLDNLDEVMKSLEIITSDWGFGWSPRRVTVSTIGLWPAVKTFVENTRCHLAVSMHSPFEQERQELMPMQKKVPLKKIVDYLKDTTFENQRRLSFEYIMFRNFNDTARHVNEISRLLNGLKCRINLIRFHEVPGMPFRTSDDKTIEKFMIALNNKGIRTTIRASRGQDIEAACGLLSTQGKKGK